MFCSSKGAFLAVLLPVIHLSPICVALRCGGRGPFYNLLIKSQILNGLCLMAVTFTIVCPVVQLLSLFSLLPPLPTLFPVYFLEAQFHVDWVVEFPLPPQVKQESWKLQQAGLPFPPAGVRFESCALTKSFLRERRPWLRKRSGLVSQWFFLASHCLREENLFWILVVRTLWNSWRGKPTKIVSLLRLCPQEFLILILLHTQSPAIYQFMGPVAFASDKQVPVAVSLDSPVSPDLGWQFAL